MASRIPQARLPTIQVTPAARVVDTYVRPTAVPDASPATALAEALQSIQPGLRAYLQDRQGKKDEKDVARARKDALTQAQSDIKEVQAGTLFAQESRVYQQTYKQQRGLIEGQRIRGEAVKAYTEQGLENSTDPAEFDTFFGDFLKKNLEGITDPDVLTGALGVVEQSANNLSLQHAAKVSENIQNGILEDAVTLVSGSLDTEIETALREKRDFNPATVMQSINASNSRMKFLQLPGPALRKQLTDAIVEKAVLHADPSILRVLDEKMDLGSGKTVPLSDGYWKANRDSVQQRVEARQVQLSEQIAQQAERGKKARLEQGQGVILQLFAKNPYAMPSATDLADWEAFAPGLAEQALTLRNKLIEAREKRSPQASLAAFAAFAQDPSDIGKLFNAAGGLDASFIKMGLQFYERASKYGEGNAADGWRSITANPAVAPFMARFDAAATDPILKDLATDPGVLAEARSEFNLSVLEYMEQNPKATLRDVKKFTRDTFQDITQDARGAMSQGKQLEDVRKPANPKTPAAAVSKPEAPAGGSTYDD